MAGGALLLHLYQERVSVAVIGDAVHLLGVPAGGSLVPQLLTAPAPEPGVAGFHRAGQAGAVHVSQHQHLVRLHILDDGRDQSPVIELQLADIDFHNRTSTPLLRKYSFTWRIVNFL